MTLPREFYVNNDPCPCGVRGCALHGFEHAGFYGKSPGEIPSETFDIIPFKRKFGVELESKTGTVKASESVFYACHDGSVAGPEYVSPILQGDTGFEAIEELCKHPSLTTDHKCGFHLHLDARDLSPRQIAKVGMGYKIIQDKLYPLVAPSRTNNHFCRKITSLYNKKIKKEDQLRKAIYIDGDKKYEFFNASSLHAKGNRRSLEIRLHEGTFNAAHILEWINFNQALFVFFLSGHFRIDRPKKSGEIFQHLFYLFPFTKTTYDARLKRYKPASDGNPPSVAEVQRTALRDSAIRGMREREVRRENAGMGAAYANFQYSLARD